MITDEQGRFVVEAIPAGTYRLVADHANQKIALPQPIVVEPESTIRLLFSAQTRRIRVRILDTDGRTPLSRTPCLVSFGDSPYPQSTVRTDQDGWFVMEHAALASIHISAIVDGSLRDVPVTDSWAETMVLTVSDW